jgi:hypothetical protein
MANKVTGIAATINYLRAISALAKNVQGFPLSKPRRVRSRPFLRMVSEPQRGGGPLIGADGRLKLPGGSADA